MLITINDSKTTAVIDSVGAQLISLKDTAGREYVWQRDPAFWPRCSPLLFPIVGNARGNQLTIEGVSYEMEKHGFCKEVDFDVTRQAGDQVTFAMKDTESTRKSYPYAFILSLSYQLSDGVLSMEYQVQNTDSRTILYCIGAHPGFNCPLNEGEVFEDYVLEFEKAETTSSVMYDRKLMEFNPDKRGLVLNGEQRIALNRELFKDDAIYFDQAKSRKVSLVHKDSGKGIEVAYPGFETVAFWTAHPAEAPFLCIEPWNGSGICSNEDGRMESRNHLQLLPVGKSKSYRMDVRILG